MSRKSIVNSVLNSIFKFNNDITKEFPNIKITYSSVDNQYNAKSPIFYRLEKERPEEIPRIGCNPIKRLDRDLTEPTKQVLILDRLSESNIPDTLEFIKQLREANLNIDINTMVLDTNKQEDMDNQLLGVIYQLPKIPILISLSKESSFQILKLFKKYSNPLFPFAILRLNRNEVGNVKNLTDIYVVDQPEVRDNNNNNDSNDNNNNSNNYEINNNNNNQNKHNNVKNSIFT